MFTFTHDTTVKTGGGGARYLCICWGIFLFWQHFIWFLVVIQVFVEATLDLHQEQSWDQLRCLYRGPSRVMTPSLCSSWRASSFTLLHSTQIAKQITSEILSSFVSDKTNNTLLPQILNIFSFSLLIFSAIHPFRTVSQQWETRTSNYSPTRIREFPT